jgi:ubiquinone biosynthesis protein UbiJ
MSTEKMPIDDQLENKSWFESTLINTINKAMNKSLSYDVISVKKLDAFNDSVIHIMLLSTPFEFYIKVQDREILLSTTHSGEINTTIKGTPIALFSMNAEEPIAGIKNVEINGDANTGQFFAKWMKNLDPDWEEAWCDLLGDGMGVRASNIAKSLLDFGQRFKQAIVSNTSEYLVEESRDLIAPSEMEDFLDDVDDLKADTARLEQQINALKISHY